MDFNSTKVNTPPKKRLQYSVEFSCKSCVETVKRCLEFIPDISIVRISLEEQTLILDSTLPCQTISDIIESTGKRAVIVGVGNSNSDGSTLMSTNCAVCMLGDVKSGAEFGVVRMFQAQHGSCIFDGTIDGLNPGQKYTMAIHEFGDISQGNRSCGDIISSIPGSDLELREGMGVITTDELASSSGRISFVEELHQLPLWGLIGRSIIIHLQLASGERFAGSCGIIARAAGLFQNSKKICACDGVTLWEERNVPIAGGDRKKRPNSNL